jgi:hypothetical protein
MNNVSGIFNIRLKMHNEEAKLNNLIEIRNGKQEIYNKALKAGAKIHGNSKKSMRDSILMHDKEIKKLEKKVKLYKAISNIGGSIFDKTAGGLFSGSYLMESDQAIRDINLELGNASHNAEQLRQNIYLTSTYAQTLGANVKDLADIQRGYSEESGRARVFTGQMMKDVATIAQGTGMGAQNAGRLAAQFELMGIHGTKTLEYVRGIVDTSERMGVNSLKVFKKLDGNFKTLQKYTFRGGVRAMAELAQHAEKFNYDMGSMLDSAEKARTLEGAVKLAAELQVMGGEFAKTDPFQMLFLSRNDPDKFAKKINSMTAGIATFRKNSEGTFEKFISPVDIDRLEKVGQALGMQRGELTQQAYRMADIQKARQQMLGTGFSMEERKLVENLASFDSNSGRMLVQVGNYTKDISKLTRDDIELLKVRGKSLEQRAKDSQTFDKAFQNTIQAFKSTLLPVLTGVNAILDTVKPITDKLAEWTNWMTNSKAGAMAFVGGLMTAAFTWKKLVSPIISTFGNRLASSIAGGAGGSKNVAPKLGGGKAAMRGGMGKGAAGLGIGAGVGLAATGIAQLAESMSKLDKTQIWALPVTILALAGAFWALSPALIAVGTSGTVSAVGLLAVGGAALGIGAGIGIASAGIGYMAKGLAELVTAANESDGSLVKLAGGLLAVNSAMALGGVTSLFGGAGMLQLRGTLNSIAKNSDELNKVGDAFKNISVVMNGDLTTFKEIEKTIKSITKLSNDKNSSLANLGKMFDKPLQVEFRDKEVAFVSNISLNMDGSKIAKSTFTEILSLHGSTKNRLNYS